MIYVSQAWDFSRLTWGSRWKWGCNSLGYCFTLIIINCKQYSIVLKWMSRIWRHILVVLILIFFSQIPAFLEWDFQSNIIPGMKRSDFVVKVTAYRRTGIFLPYDMIYPSLTHYQTTNFRLFQIERVCRQQFQIWWKWKKVIQTGRNHWEKEKLLVTSNFSFSFSVFKRLVSQGCQKVLLCGNGLNWRGASLNLSCICDQCRLIWD